MGPTDGHDNAKDQRRDSAGPLHFRWMLRDDWASVIGIFARNGMPEWSSSDLRQYLSRHERHGIVAIDSRNHVCGVVLYEQSRGGDSAGIRIDQIAVDPICQRRGYGAQLTNYLVRRLSLEKPMLVVDVPESNTAAQCFFRACGLRASRLVGHDEDDLPMYRMRRGRRTVSDAIATLERATGVGWELAREGPEGRLVTADESQARFDDYSNFVLRSAKPTKHPHEACEAMNRIWKGAFVPAEGGPEGSARVAIPASYMLSTFDDPPGRVSDISRPFKEDRLEGAEKADKETRSNTFVDRENRERTREGRGPV